MYKVLALAGKAGSGKDTILRRVVNVAPDQFHEIISCTTRPMREGEAEGVNYFYFTPAQFQQAVIAGEMLEFTEFNNWYYGTPLQALRNDKINVGVFNPAGLYKLYLDPLIDLSIIHIFAKDKERLLRQLNRETNPDAHEIVRRFSTDENDFKDFMVRFPDALWLRNNDIDDLSLNVDVILTWAKQGKI